MTYGLCENGGAAVVTLNTGTQAQVTVSGELQPSPGEEAFLSFEVEGATTQIATDARALIKANDPGQGSMTTLITNLNEGSNTFAVRCKAVGGTVSFVNRTISVIPLN